MENKNNIMFIGLDFNSQGRKEHSSDTLLFEYLNAHGNSSPELSQYLSLLCLMTNEAHAKKRQMGDLVIVGS